jgi:esterase/lipase superfamily enzyme
MATVIHVRGNRSALIELRQELEAEFNDQQVVISEPTPYIPLLAERPTYRQIELFDIIITVAINLASSAVYEHLKRIISDYKHQRSIQVHESHVEDRWLEGPESKNREQSEN